MIKCQCGYCLHRMGVPESMAGRRILCPLCHDPLTIPQPGEQPALRPFALADAIPKIQWSEWDRAIARYLHEGRRFSEQALYDHIADFMKTRARQQYASFAEFLVAHGALSQAEAASIREALRGAVKDVQAEFVECANCFARIVASSRACKFCGQRIGDPAFDTCPRCKHEQKKGGRVCERCHANLQTGIVEAVSRCPACGKLMFGGPRACPACKAILQKPGERRAAADAQLRRRRAVIGYVAAAGLIIAVCLIALRKPIALAWRACAVGYAQASLERQAADLCAAIMSGRAEAIAASLGTAATGKAPAELFALVAAVSGREKIARIVAASIVQAAVANDENAGSTTVALKLAAATADEDDVPALRANMQTRAVTWHWRRAAGVWQWREASCP